MPAKSRRPNSDPARHQNIKTKIAKIPTGFTFPNSIEDILGCDANSGYTKNSVVFSTAVDPRGIYAVDDFNSTSQGVMLTSNEVIFCSSPGDGFVTQNTCLSGKEYKDKCSVDFSTGRVRLQYTGNYNVSKIQCNGYNNVYEYAAGSQKPIVLISRHKAKYTPKETRELNLKKDGVPFHKVANIIPVEMTPGVYVTPAPDGTVEMERVKSTGELRVRGPAGPTMQFDLFHPDGKPITEAYFKSNPKVFLM